MSVPVRSDHVIALMLPAWGRLLGYTHGDQVVSPALAKGMPREVRELYRALAKGDAPVTADAIKGATERYIRETLAPFEDRVPSAAEVAALPPLVRERYEDFQRVRREAHLAQLAEGEPFPEGIVDRRYFDVHLQVRALELGEKLIRDHDLIQGTSRLIRALRGKPEKVLPDGTKLRVVNDPKDGFGRPLFVTKEPVLEIERPGGEKLHAGAGPGRIELAGEHGRRVTYMAESPEESLAKLTGRKPQRMSRLRTLEQHFFLSGVDLGTIGACAIAIDGARNRGREGAAIQRSLRAHERGTVALLGQLMIRGEWPAKLREVADHLANGRTMKLEGDRVRLSIKDKLEINVWDADYNEQKVTLRTEGGPFIHVRESHGNRDFGVAIPPLAEGRLELTLVGDKRQAEHVSVEADGSMKDLDLRLPALGNLEEDLMLAWRRVKGLRPDAGHGA